MSGSVTAATAAATRALYRETLRTAGQYRNSNFREYFTRRARDEFRERAAAGGGEAAAAARLQQARADLTALRRQVNVQNMYFDRPTVATP